MAVLLQHLTANLLQNLLVLLEELAGLVAPLAESQVAICEPRAALLHDAFGSGEVEDVSCQTDAAAAEHVELRRAERRGDLVLDDLGLHADADRLFAIFEGGDPTDVDAAGRVELE